MFHFCEAATSVTYTHAPQPSTPPRCLCKRLLQLWGQCHRAVFLPACWALCLPLSHSAITSLQSQGSLCVCICACVCFLAEWVCIETCWSGAESGEHIVWRYGEQTRPRLKPQAEQRANRIYSLIWIISDYIRSYQVISGHIMSFQIISGHFR